MALFHPKLDILPKPQLALWPELAGFPPGFVLYGGTAVALHLGHRQSVDFDFFGNTEFAPLDLASSLTFLHGGKVLQSEPSTLTMLIDRGGPVKISFFGVPKLKRIKPPLVAAGNGLKISSLVDLAGTKMAVVQQRAEAKDYIDIDAMIRSQQVNLPLALSAGLMIYGSVFSPQNALKALTYFDEPQLRSLSHDLKFRLVNAVRSVDLSDLPHIAVEGAS